MILSSSMNPPETSIDLEGNCWFEGVINGYLLLFLSGRKKVKRRKVLNNSASGLIF